MRLSAQETRTGQAQPVTRLEEEEVIILQEAEKASEKSPRQHRSNTSNCRGCFLNRVAPAYTYPSPPQPGTV
jgi:hypothetical protein